PVFVVEGGMNKQRPLGRDSLANVETDARVSFAAMPIAPVALHLAESRRHLTGSGFDFLQADDVRTLAVDPLLELALPRPDAVDVPCGDLHRCQLSAISFQQEQDCRKHGAES